MSEEVNVEQLCHELNITNADHIALWLEANLPEAGLPWLACRIVEAHEAILRNPPRHRFWGAGEPDCPSDIKASNGELHTLRCKVCGSESDPNGACFARFEADLRADRATATDAAIDERLLKSALAASAWLRECSTWMLSNDLDMTCPMEVDPLDIADSIDGAISILAALRSEP